MRPPNLLLFFSSVLLLGVVHLGCLLLGIPARFVYLSAILLLILMPYLRSIFLRDFEILEVIYIFLFLYFLEYFLKPLILVISEESEEFVHVPYAYTGEHFDLTLLAVLLGLVAIYAGYYSPLGRILARTYPNLGEGYSTSRANLMFWLLFSFGVSMYLLSAYISFGGIKGFYLAVSGDRGAAGQGRGYMTLVILSINVSAMIYLSYLFHRGRRFYKAPSFYILFIFLGFLLYITASRATFFTIIVVTLVFFHYKYRRFRTWEAISLASFLIVSAVLITQLRRPEASFSPLQRDFWVGFVTNLGGFDGFTAILGYIPSQEGFHYGRILMGSLLYSYIPRSIWTDKPVIYGYASLQKTFGVSGYGETQFTSYSTSIFGDGYADFGWIGIALYLFLLGAIYKSFYLKFRENTGKDGYLVVYAFFLCSIIGEVRDGFAHLLLQLPWYVIILFLFKYIQSQRPPAKRLRLGPSLPQTLKRR